MTYGSTGTVRGRWSFARMLATLSESLGLLNKGSAEAPAVPSPGDVANVQPVSSNTLNVTRVGGLTALISGAGGVALLLFNVNKSKDRASIVVAAYVSVGVIVAAALLAAAIIIVADIHARTTVAVAVSPSGRTNAQVRSVVPPTVVPPQDAIVSLDRAYDYVLADATAANLILMLPSAGSASCQPMTIKRKDNTVNYLHIRPQNAEQIFGQPRHELRPADSVQIYSDGKNWLAV